MNIRRRESIILTLIRIKLLWIILICGFVAIPIDTSAQEIFDAIRAGDLARVKTLIESDISIIASRNSHGDTPLHIAAIADNAEIAGLLIEQGADIEAQNGSLYTPLMRAGLNVTRLLVERGADIDFISDNSQMTALAVAMMWKDREVAEYLLRSGAKIPEPGSPQFWPSLFDAMKKGITLYLDRSLDKGIDPLFTGESESSLIHYAAESGSVELLDKLQSLGVPYDRKNIYGWAPIHNAACRGNEASVSWFLGRGIDPDVRTNDGRTPLSLAVEVGNDEIIGLLNDSGADQGPPRFPRLTGEYLGQTRSGHGPAPFAPDIIAATHRFHSTIAFSKEGDEAYWGCPYILGSRLKDGTWTRPDTTSLIKWGDAPFFSPDGERLYFVAQVGERMWGREAIHYVDRTPSGWSEEKALPEVINSTPGIHFPMSVDIEGNLYFGAREPGTVVSRIYHSSLSGGSWSEPVRVEHLKDLDASSPYIAPDGSYLIVSSKEPAGLLVSFRNDDGSWSRGGLLTESGLYPDRGPIVSHDGRHLFYLHFTDDRYIPWWVDTGVIEAARHRVGLGSRGPLPEVFLPGTVSLDDHLEFGCSWSPDGREFYFTRRGGKYQHNTLMVTSRQADGSWTEPKVAGIPDPYPKMSPRFFPDGRAMVYTAWRPPASEDDKRSPFSIWITRRSGGIWQDPEPFREWFSMSVSDGGSIYFHGSEGIGISRKDGEEWSVPVILGDEINTGNFDQHPFVSPDGSFFLFDSHRTGGYGESDLYVAFPDDEGKMYEVVNLGPDINTAGPDFCPALSPDGKYLVYTSGEDIYRVGIGIIEKLRTGRSSLR